MKNTISIVALILSITILGCNNKAKKEDTQRQDEAAEEIIEAVQSEIKTPENLADILQNLPLERTPISVSVKLDNNKAVKELSAQEISLLQLSKVYPEIEKEGANYTFWTSYTLEFSEGFNTIVLNVQSKFGVEVLLLNYDLQDTLIAHNVIAYDKLAEGTLNKQATIENNIITAMVESYKSSTIDTTKFHINTIGDINPIKTKFSSDLRPNEAIKLDKMYADTIAFKRYNDDGDYRILFGTKNGKEVSLFYNWDWRYNNEFNFNHGDSIVVNWGMAEAYMAGDGETLFYREKAMDAERISSENRPITFLWREEQYDEASKQNINSIFINEPFCYAISDEEKAALGFVATFIGNECMWDGRANEDRSNLQCKILTALNLGYQCSDTHLGYLKRWFSRDNSALKELEACPTMPETATIQTTFDEITIDTDKDHKTITVSYKVSGMNMRASKTWHYSQTDTFEYSAENMKRVASEKSERIEETFNDNPDN